MLEILQAFIELRLLGRQFAHGHAQCGAPELGGTVEIIGLAIDDESSKFAFVHLFLQICP
jgi:hypothetical protein